MGLWPEALGAASALRGFLEAAESRRPVQRRPCSPAQSFPGGFPFGKRLSCPSSLLLVWHLCHMSTVWQPLPRDFPERVL